MIRACSQRAREVARSVHLIPEGTERYEKRFRVGAPENPMSKYLNDLIKSLQAEAKEHEAALQEHAAPTGRGFRRDNGYLGRFLQRIKSLEELQVSEAKRHRQLLRSAVATGRQRAVSASISVHRKHTFSIVSRGLRVVVRPWGR
jgi:hypothetical protein